MTLLCTFSTIKCTSFSQTLPRQFLTPTHWTSSNSNSCTWSWCM